MTKTWPIWAYSMDGNTYAGHFPTLDAATHEAKLEAENGPHEVFWVGQCKHAPAPEAFWAVENWIEHVSEQDDYSGEWADGWYDGDPKLEAELEEEVRKVLGAWLDRHNLRPNFFNIDPESVFKFQYMGDGLWERSRPFVKKGPTV